MRAIDPAATSKHLRYWFCLIGPVEDDKLPHGADYLPRMAARQAVLRMTGDDPVCSSGWCDEAEYQRLLAAQREKN